MEALWRGMFALFGSQWDQFNTDDARRIWAMGLRRMTRQMVIDGMNRLRDGEQRDFPPNLPQFREICTRARRLTCRAELMGWLGGKAFTDPAAYAIWQKIGGYDLRHATQQRWDTAFDKAFDELDFNRLPDLPERNEAQIEHKPTTLEVGQEELRKIREQFRL